MAGDVVTQVSTTERLVLSMLCGRGGEMFGLQMIEASGGQLRRGTIYFTLASMELRGLIESRPERSPSDASDLPRRLYKATEAGAQALRDADAQG